MMFKEVSDRLRKLGFTLDEVADALGLKHQTVRSMRNPYTSPNFRVGPSPEVWTPKIAAMLRTRAKALEIEAERLTKGLTED